MAENMPSLFDFDDEELFPSPDVKQEKGKKNAKEAADNKQDETGIRKETRNEDDLEREPETNVATSSEKETRQVPAASEESNDSASSEKLEDASISSPQKTSKEENPQKAFIKPSLELPQTTSTVEKPDEVAASPGIYDRQINALNPPEKTNAAFTFEPRREDKKQTEGISKETTGKEKKPIQVAEKEEASSEGKDLPEWELNKKYYTIGEVAKLFEVNVSHIRFWTTEFRMKTRTTRKGDRLYTPQQIGELRLIHHLVKVKKHTLKGAKEALQKGSTQLEKKLDLREELQKLHQLLSEIRESL